MKSNKIKLLIYVLLSTTTSLSGCAFIKQVEKKILPKEANVKTNVIETRDLIISCEREDIQNYINMGWKVIDKEESDTPCSWKTKKAKPRCNIEKDKGCLITIPDKMGKKIKYLLERESNSKKQIK